MRHLTFEPSAKAELIERIVSDVMMDRDQRQAADPPKKGALALLPAPSDIAAAQPPEPPAPCED